jgi:hypothetical protein
MSVLYQPIDKYDSFGTFKLQKFYKASSVLFDVDTVQEMIFVPWPVPKKEDYPWAIKEKYRKPVMPFEGSTVNSSR